MRVGIDLDGVGHIFERGFAESALAYGVKDWQLHIVRALLTGEAQTWTFYEQLGLTAQEFIDICNYGADQGTLFAGHVHDGFADAVARIKSAGHEVHIITDRPFGATPEVSQVRTRYWLASLGVPYDSLTFSADKTCVPTDIFIEDKPENYDALRAAGVKCYLVNRPWNKSHPVPSAHRVDSIGEFADLVVNRPWVDTMKRGEEVRVTSATGGEKGRKLAELGSVDPKALLLLAEVSGFGAQKYAAFNFLKGYDWSLSFNALQRHLLAFWSGEDNDPESEMPHLAHAAWHCLALLSFQSRVLGTDDRPPT